MAVSRRATWIITIAGVAVALVVAAVVTVVLLRRDDVTAVPVSDAVDQFRQGSSTTAAAATTSPFVPATTSPVPVTAAVATHTPDAGVYVYAPPAPSRSTPSAAPGTPTRGRRR